MPDCIKQDNNNYLFHTVPDLSLACADLTPDTKSVMQDKDELII